jgi:hypothetical protein
MARDFTVRAIRAWRKLLPDWTPTLDMLRDLDTRPHEHIAAVRIVAKGWSANDARWDVLMALLEYERREENARARAEYWSEPGRVDAWVEEVLMTDDEPAEECSDDPEDRIVIPFKVVNRAGQVFQSGETTVETPLKAAFLNNVRPVKHLREKDTHA